MASKWGSYTPRAYTGAAFAQGFLQSYMQGMQMVQEEKRYQQNMAYRQERDRVADTQFDRTLKLKKSTAETASLQQAWENQMKLRKDARDERRTAAYEKNQASLVANRGRSSSSKGGLTPTQQREARDEVFKIINNADSRSKAIVGAGEYLKWWGLSTREAKKFQGTVNHMINEKFPDGGEQFYGRYSVSPDTWDKMSDQEKKDWQAVNDSGTEQDMEDAATFLRNKYADAITAERTQKEAVAKKLAEDEADAKAAEAAWLAKNPNAAALRKAEAGGDLGYTSKSNAPGDPFGATYGAGYAGERDPEIVSKGLIEEAERTQPELFNRDKLIPGFQVYESVNGPVMVPEGIGSEDQLQFDELMERLNSATDPLEMIEISKQLQEIESRPRVFPNKPRPLDRYKGKK